MRNANGRKASGQQARVWLPAAVTVGFLLLLVATVALFQLRRMQHQPVHATNTERGSASTAGLLNNDDPITMERITQLQAAARVLDPDLISWGPPSTGTDLLYKNPCWKTPSSNITRCLPYAFVSSFHTGSVSLAARLMQHPSLVMDAGNLSYWGSSWGWWSEYRNSLLDYLVPITSTAAAAIEAAPRTAIIIDSSMSTFALYWAGSGMAHRAFSKDAVACWTRCHKNFLSGPLYEACMDNICLPEGRESEKKAADNAGIPYADVQLPMLMRAVYGAHAFPRLLVLLRDPVERAHSAFYGLESMHHKYGKSPEGFQAFVDEQVGAFEACVTTNRSADTCAMYFETLSMQQEKVHYHCDNILRGTYALWLEVWARFLPRTAVLTIHSVDYFQNPKRVLQQVMDWLGVSQPSPQEWISILAAGAPVSNVQGRSMPNPARKRLVQFYKPWNERLSVFLGGDQRVLSWGGMV